MPAAVLLPDAEPRAALPAGACVRQALVEHRPPVGSIVFVPANAGGRRDWAGAVFTQTEFEAADAQREETSYWRYRDVVRALLPWQRTQANAVPVTVMFADLRNQLPEISPSVALFVFVADPVPEPAPDHISAWVQAGERLDWLVGRIGASIAMDTCHSRSGPPPPNLAAFAHLMQTFRQKALVVDSYWAGPASNVPWRACWPPVSAISVTNDEKRELAVRTCAAVVSLPASAATAGLLKVARHAGRRTIHAATFNTLVRLSRLKTDERHLAGRSPVAPLPKWALAQVGLDGRSGVCVVMKGCCHGGVVPYPEGAGQDFDEHLLTAVQSCLAQMDKPVPFDPRALVVTLLAPLASWRRTERPAACPVGYSVGLGSVDLWAGWHGIVLDRASAVDYGPLGSTEDAWLIRSDEIRCGTGLWVLAAPTHEDRKAPAGAGTTTTGNHRQPLLDSDPDSEEITADAAAGSVRKRARPRHAAGKKPVTGRPGPKRKRKRRRTTA